MKKKEKVLIIITIVILIMILVGATVFAGYELEKKNKRIEKKVVENYKDSQTITCTLEKNKEDIEQIEEVYIEKGILIARINRYTWSREEAKEVTCKHYTSLANNSSTLAGVSSVVNCDAFSGNVTTTYTIAELDKDNIKLNQFDYIKENNTFDYAGWKYYMQNKGYSCVES